ncbi:MAG: ABC transporter substrate-binding protein [Dehalococcoidia bacterium]|nr:ABC transporter substrate-binding protein [Dehalococcoidia bacterium]
MQHQFNRTRFFYILLGLCSLLIAAACGPSATQAPSGTQGGAQPPTTSDKPQKGGILKLMGGGYVSYGTTDAHRASFGPPTGFSAQSVNQVVKRNLMSGKYEIIPELAESWTQSPDGLTYTFKLQKGVKFQNLPPVNGREFTSDDVEYMIKRISADPAIVLEKWTQLFTRRSDFTSISSIEKPDKYTIIVKMKQPDAVFMHNLATIGSIIVPKEMIDENPDKLIQDKIIGTGPFICKEYVPDVRHYCDRNPDYWKKDADGVQLPYFDRLEKNFYSGGDTSGAVAAFLSSQTDVLAGSIASFSLTDADIKTVMNQMKDKAYMIANSGSNFSHLRINATRAPFNNVKMRQAVNLAIDRQQIIDSTVPGGAELSGIVPPALSDGGAQTGDELMKLPGYRPQKDQDIAEAKKLVKDAGFEGVTIEMNTSGGTATSADQASLVKQQLAKIGITVNIKLTANYQDHLNEMLADKFQLTWTGHGASPDFDEYIYKHLHSKGARNYYKFSDPKWDQLADKQRFAANLEERKKAVKEAVAYHEEIVPNVILYASLNQSIYRNYTHGWGKPVQPYDGLTSFDEYWMEKR